MFGGGEFFILESSVGSFVLGKRIIMLREHFVEEYSVGVNDGRIKLISPSESKGHSILRRNLSLCEWVNTRNRSSNIGQRLIEQILFNVNVWVMCFV